MGATLTKRQAESRSEVKNGNRQHLHGEVIAWSVSKVEIKHLDLVTALKDAGLDESVARELLPRHAFSRACKKLGDQRIIKQLKDDGGWLDFQFNREAFAGDRIDYPFETVLRVNKSTGDIDCPIAELQQLAKTELDRCMDVRTANDVTRCVQRLFEKEDADMFPIRRAGGAYFVAQAHVDFVERVHGFLSKVGGEMERLPIAAGTSHGDRSVRDAVAGGLAQIIYEHEAAVETFGEDTRDSTLERHAERIQTTRFKIEAYASYLGQEKAKLEASLEEAAKKLRSKVAGPGYRDHAPASYPVKCDHCGEKQTVPEDQAELVCVKCGKTSPVEWS